MSLSEWSFEQIHKHIMEQAKNYPDVLPLIQTILEQDVDQIFRLLPIFIAEEKEILCLWQNHHFCITIKFDYTHLPSSSIAVQCSVTEDCPQTERERCFTIARKLQTIIPKMGTTHVMAERLKFHLDTILDELKCRMEEHR